MSRGDFVDTEEGHWYFPIDTWLTKGVLKVNNYDELVMYKGERRLEKKLRVVPGCCSLLDARYVRVTLPQLVDSPLPTVVWNK